LKEGQKKMKNGNLLIALVIGGIIGFVVGKATSTTTPVGDAAPAAAAADSKKPAEGPRPATADQIFKVPVGDDPNVIRGPNTAKVTIVEFSDFECPFCQRAWKTVDDIEKKYGKDVRIVFKQNPLPMHPHAQPAAEAALAAAEQGKFWEMHDKMFAMRDHLERADLDKYATEIGLDMAKFKASMDANKYKDRITAEEGLAQRFQAGGTPHFFINGHRLVGAQPIESFTKVIDAEIKKADALLASGTPAAGLYDALTKTGLDKADPPSNNPSPQKDRPAQQTAYIVDPGEGPSIGPKDAKVTIVEWSDFQCPYCSRAKPVVDQIVKAYPKDVRVLFRHEPLPFHPNAMPAAIASMAAANQGKFWEFYDLAFTHQTELSKQIGLNVAKFKKDLEDPATKQKVQDDSSYGQKVGANGTPTFYVNGRQAAGALPFENFKPMIEEEIKKADDLLKAGTPRADLYKKLNEMNVKNAPKPAPQQGGDDDNGGKPVDIALGNSPVRGAKNAKVTIVEFSDFQCPFCGRVEPTVDALLKKYDGKIKVVWKNQPLPFHPNARPAAKAAMAANDQGEFWEMHAKLFANQAALSDEKYEQFAKEIGLDMAKFKADVASTKYDAAIDADSTQGKGVGANGTPTFFINGKKFVGAQPQEAFEAQIDAALKG
jgi:protein-disulfide isomerase